MDLLRTAAQPPILPLRWALRLLIFPTGYPYNEPFGSLGHIVAALLLAPTASRDRLAAGIYVNRDAAEKIGQLELALQQAEDEERIEGTLRGALNSGLIEGSSVQMLLQQAVSQGILSVEEQREFETMERLRRKVIRVDAFDDYGMHPTLEATHPVIDASVPKSRQTGG